MTLVERDANPENSSPRWDGSDGAGLAPLHLHQMYLTTGGAVWPRLPSLLDQILGTGFILGRVNQPAENAPTRTLSGLWETRLEMSLSASAQREGTSNLGAPPGF